MHGNVKSKPKTYFGVVVVPSTRGVTVVLLRKSVLPPSPRGGDTYVTPSVTLTQNQFFAIMLRSE